MASVLNFGIVVITASLLLTTTMALTSDYPTSVDVFSARFCKAVASENPDKNVVTSGLSAEVVLLMVGMAARGATQREIADVLFIENIETIIPSAKKSTEELNDAKVVVLSIATKIYTKLAAHGKLDTIDPAYRSSVNDIFKSEIQQLDFSENKKAADIINEWVEGKTNNRIKNIVDPLSFSAATSAVLVSALYFKGSWKNEFEDSETKQEDFTLGNLKTAKVTMMNQRHKFQYAESTELDAQIIQLPYQGFEASMYVYLPKKKDGLDSLLLKLADGTKQFIADDKLSTYDVNLKLPKFKTETTIQVKKLLQNLGMKRLFTPEGQINGILKGEPVVVSDAVQKVFIEVDEKGSEAAAATAIFVNVLTPSMPFVRLVPRVNFYADYPFYYQILLSDQVMFSGVYRSPEK